jgi:hypothetical protein
MGAKNCFSKASWKSVFTSQEALEKPSVAPMRLQKPVLAPFSFRKAIKHYCKRA